MPAKREELLVKCPDGIFRQFDSFAEVCFVEACKESNVKITHFNQDKSRTVQLLEPSIKGIKSPALEGKIENCFGECEVDNLNIKNERKTEGAQLNFDFYIELFGIEFAVDVKGDFTNKKVFLHSDREYITAWQIRKAILQEKFPELPYIIFIYKKTIHGYEFRAEYRVSEQIKDDIDESRKIISLMKKLNGK